jgi:hypothetical protein
LYYVYYNIIYLEEVNNIVKTARERKETTYL